MSQPIRVLYVDDDARSLDLRASILETEYGYDIHTEPSVERGIDWLDNNSIDCVLSDYKMPGQTGLDFLEYVRNEYPNLPFILFTGHESEEIAQEAIEGGATDYFPKSVVNISYGLLAHRIEQGVERYRELQSSSTDVANNDEKTADDGFIWVGDQSSPTEPKGIQSENRPPQTDHTSLTAKTWDNRDSVFDTLSESEADDSGTIPRVKGLSGDFGLDAATAAPGGNEHSTAKKETPAEPDSAFLSAISGSRDEPDTEDEGEVSSNHTTVLDMVQRAIASESTSDAGSLRQNETNPFVNMGGSTEIQTNDDPASDAAQVRAEQIGDQDETHTNRDQVTLSQPGSGESIQERKRGDSLQNDRVESNVDTGGYERSQENTQRGQSEPSTALKPTTSPSGRDKNSDTTPSPPLTDDEVTGDDTDTGSSPTTEQSQTDSSTAPIEGNSQTRSPSTEQNLNDEGTEEKAGSSDTQVEDSVSNTGGGMPQSGEWNSSSEYERPTELDLDPGTNVLVQCNSQDDRKHAACTDLLCTDMLHDQNVLLIRYNHMEEERLTEIVDVAARVKLVSVGYNQPVPTGYQDEIERVQINNPNDVTRLGIVVTGTLENWQSTGEQTVVCFDPLDVLLRYKNVQSTFRFLHIFVGKLRSAGAISHFHVDPTAEDPQEINSLKPLFDEVINIDSVGTTLESG